jgi:hypothetical protein
MPLNHLEGGEESGLWSIVRVEKVKGGIVCDVYHIELEEPAKHPRQVRHSIGQPERRIFRPSAPEALSDL